MEFCMSEDHIADIFTKPLKAKVFYKLKKMMGMCKSESLCLREAVGI
ncbi:hypothetical protein Patl1_26099 [Pistacia atlantica]|uniref:Uncharacterized protein n=1 Tax=Pistacia atlantica TaxID=434234 RepID=A0ACC1B110_9ROSI|nr:hypothetical protein Patl1_26099 [Pistacia atlantica]